MIGLYIFIVGLLMGSFFLVIGTRLPLKENVITGRSRCDSCLHPLSWYELIPIFSFIIQGGKCRHCGKPISGIHLIMEIVTGLLYLAGYLYFGLSLDLGIYLILISCTLVIFISDFKYMVILDSTLIVSSLLVLLLQFLKGGVELLVSSILCGIGLFFTMFLVKKIGDKVFKRESLGGGDIKLCFLIGASIGYRLGLISLIFASFLAFPYAIAIVYLNKKNELPYGPFLIAACTIIFIFIDKFTTLLELFSLT